MVLEKNEKPDWYEKRSYYIKLLRGEKFVPGDHSEAFGEFKSIKLVSQKNIFSENNDLIKNLSIYLNEKYYDGVSLIPERILNPEADENGALLILEKNKNKDIRYSEYFCKEIKKKKKDIFGG